MSVTTSILSVLSSTTEPSSPSSPSTSGRVPASDLAQTSEERTIRDVVDLDAFEAAIPDTWEARFEVVYGINDRLDDAVVLETDDAKRLTIVPTSLLDPEGDIEVYYRRSPFADRRRLTTYSRLGLAQRRVARNLHALE